MDTKAKKEEAKRLREMAAAIREDAQTAERDWSTYMARAQRLEDQARQIEADINAEMRRRLMAKIHIGKKQLRLDEEDYRLILNRVTAKRRLTEMSTDELGAVVNEMKRLGVTYHKHRRPRPSQGKKNMASKIIAMMKSIGHNDAYVDAMAKRMFGIDRWEWLDEEQTEKLLAALAIYQRRRKKEEKT